MSAVRWPFWLIALSMRMHFALPTQVFSFVATETGSKALRTGAGYTCRICPSLRWNERVFSSSLSRSLVAAPDIFSQSRIHPLKPAATKPFIRRASLQQFRLINNRTRLHPANLYRTQECRYRLSSCILHVLLSISSALCQWRSCPIISLDKPFRTVSSHAPEDKQHAQHSREIRVTPTRPHEVWWRSHKHSPIILQNSESWRFMKTSKFFSSSRIVCGNSAW